MPLTFEGVFKPCHRLAHSLRYVCREVVANFIMDVLEANVQVFLNRH